MDVSEGTAVSAPPYRAAVFAALLFLFLASMAGLEAKHLSFRNILSVRQAAARFAIVRFATVAYQEPAAGFRCAAQQQRMKEAPIRCDENSAR